MAQRFSDSGMWACLARPGRNPSPRRLAPLGLCRGIKQGVHRIGYRSLSYGTTASNSQVSWSVWLPARNPLAPGAASDQASLTLPELGSLTL